MKRDSTHTKNATSRGVLMQPKKWERTTREVIYLVCWCCKRLEVPADDEGTGCKRLYDSWLLHLRSSCSPSNGTPSWVTLQARAKTEVVDDAELLDLSDIISDRARDNYLYAVALKRSSHMVNELERLDNRVRQLIARDGDYRCQHCGKLITRRQARRGYGRCAK